MLLDSSPTSYNTKSAYEAGLVTDAPNMNKTDVNGFLQERTFNVMFPPVCIKSHWDAGAFSKHVLPEDLKIPLPVDPRPLVRNCTVYATTAQAEVKEDKIKRSQLEPIGRSKMAYERFAKNINAESDLFLNHPQNNCDDNKWVASADSDLYVNKHAPPPSSGNQFSELSRPLATIVAAGPYKCRAEADDIAWSKSSRLFNNVTREDRIGGNLPRRSEGLLSKEAGLVTAKVSAQPRVWSANSIVFYVGSGDGGYLLNRLSLAFVNRGYEVAIFYEGGSKTEGGISYLSHNDYVPNDIYNVVIMWGASLLVSNYQYKPVTRVLLLNLEEDSDVSERTIKESVDKIIVRSVFHRSLITAYSWSKFEVIPNGLPVELFIQNKGLPRDRYRVLVTEYNKPLVAFIKDAWYRIVSTYPGAEIHIWSKEGDLKKELSPYLVGKGVVLHGTGSLEQMIEERFKSSVHLQLSDRVAVSNDTLRLTALAGCIPIMPSVGVNTELGGVNIDGDINNPDVLVEYAKAISAVFNDGIYAGGLRTRLQRDDGLKGWNATCDRWIKVIEGLKKTKTPLKFI